MFSGWDTMTEENENALNSLCKSLRIMAGRTTATTVYRSWDSQLRLAILRKKKCEMPLDTIVDCLADTIKYDVMMLEDCLQCKFRPNIDSSACSISRIEREAKAYLKFNGVDISQHDGLIESAIILLLERQGEEQQSREQENINKPKKVVVEYLENSALINVTNKACNPRSLLKTNQSVVLRTLKPGEIYTRKRTASFRESATLISRYNN